MTTETLALLGLIATMLASLGTAALSLRGNKLAEIKSTLESQSDLIQMLERQITRSEDARIETQNQLDALKEDFQALKRQQDGDRELIDDLKKQIDEKEREIVRLRRDLATAHEQIAILRQERGNHATE